jgi:hypothetical protein
VSPLAQLHSRAERVALEQILLLNQQQLAIWRAAVKQNSYLGSPARPLPRAPVEALPLRTLSLAHAHDHVLGASLPPVPHPVRGVSEGGGASDWGGASNGGSASSLSGTSTARLGASAAVGAALVRAADQTDPRTPMLQGKPPDVEDLPPPMLLSEPPYVMQDAEALGSVPSQAVRGASDWDGTSSATTALTILTKLCKETRALLRT